MVQTLTTDRYAFIARLAFAGCLVLLLSASSFGEDTDGAREELGESRPNTEQLEKKINSQPRQVSDTTEEKWHDRLDLGLTLGGVIQGSHGAEDDAADATGRCELELQYSAAAGDLLYLHLECGNGNGLDSRVLTLSSFNGDAFGDDDHLSVSEAWYLHRFQWLDAVLEVGKLDLAGPGDFGPEDAIWFDGNEYANNERSQFLSDAFVNNVALELPDVGPAAVIRVSPSEILDISAGVADADVNWSSVFNDVFLILQITLKPNILGHPGNYRFYGWFNGSDHEDLKDPSNNRADNYGFGFSFDQQVSAGIGIFTRYGRQRPSVSQVEQAWSIGVQYSGAMFGRKDDVLGLAYGMAILSNDWKAANQVDKINWGNEHHLELYYRLTVNKYLTLSPDIQWVKNPNGNRDHNDVWAFGVRMNVSF